MNATYKVVFNKARGALMAVNEITSSVQSKGTKTVIAAAVVTMMMAGGVVAGDAPTNGEQTEVVTPSSTKVTTTQKWEDLKAGAAYQFDVTNTGPVSFTSVTEGQETFEGELLIVPTGAGASSTGLYAAGEGVVLTNKGKVEIRNTVDSESKSWKQDAMQSASGALLVNGGELIVQNGYGMRVGNKNVTASTIQNDGVITVKGEGVGMELGGAEGSKAFNTGTIIVGEGSTTWAHGVLIQDQANATFTNTGSIKAAADKDVEATVTAIEVKGGTTNATVVLGTGSDVQGTVAFREGVTGSVLNLAGMTNALTLLSEVDDLEVNVTDGAKVALADKQKSKIKTLNIKKGQIDLSIWGDDNTLGTVNLDADGVLNITKLNSDSVANLEAHDQLLLFKNSQYNLNGGKFLVEGKAFSDGKLKIGSETSSGELNIAGDYAFGTLTVGLKGQVNVKEGGSLTVESINNHNSVSVSKGTLTIGNTMTGPGFLTLKDARVNVTVKDESPVIQLKKESGSQPTGVALEGTNVVGLTFAPGFVGDTINLFDAGLEVNAEGATLTAENTNMFYVVEAKDELGVFSVSKKNAAEVALDLVTTTTATTNEAAAAVALNVEAPAEAPAAFKAIQSQILEALQTGTVAEKQAAIDTLAAMNPDATAAANQVTTAAVQVMDTVSSRLSGGQSSGDVVLGGSLWAQGMYNKTSQDKTKKASGYDADSTGFAIGAEARFANDVKAGVGFGYSQTDVDADFRKTDVDSYTGFAYAEYKPGDWYVNGIFSYGVSKFDETKTLAISGGKAYAKHDANTIGLQVMTGYDFNVAKHAVTPEVGLRYMHLSQDGYTDSLGTTVGSKSDDILTGVLGARLSRTFATSSMLLKPELRLAMTYDMVDADNKSTVRLANGQSYTVEGESQERFGFETGLGLTAEVGDNIEVSVSYEGAYRKDFKSHTGLINAKYKF